MQAIAVTVNWTLGEGGGGAKQEITFETVKVLTLLTVTTQGIILI